jgi:deoxyribodipyrimidine photo-lyase
VTAGSGAVFAFTRDLRLTDHAGLAAAARFGPVVPVLVLDPPLIERLRRSPRRAAFYCAAVRSLAEAVRARGAALIVRRGPRGPTLRSLARSAGVGTVVWTIDYDAPTIRADRDVQSALEEAGLRAVPVHAAPVVPPEESAAAHRRGGEYRAFVPYHARWQRLIHEIGGDATTSASAALGFRDAGIPGEALPEPADFGAGEITLDRPVSEAAARASLTRFLDVPVLGYALGRNVPAADATSRLSADLGCGTIAARSVVRAVIDRSADPFLLTEERLALRRYLRSFAQRDFFLQLAWFNEALGEAPLQAKMRGFRFARTHPQLDAWRSGRTGFPLVDAGIRQLHATGWMHPFVRTVAASVLCFDLGVDWRVGRDEWDRWLIEDTPALAAGNWQWISAVGADLAAYPRIFNPLRAARRADPAALYIRRWIPELALIPTDVILDPYGRRAERQLGFDLYGPERYPAPMVDHDAAARAFLARYARDVARPVDEDRVAER